MASTKRKRARLEKNHWGYIFIAPFFIAYLVFQIVPLVDTFRYSITNAKAWFMDPSQNFDFVGIDQFKTVLADVNFKTAMYNTPVMWLMGFIPQLGMALLLAAWFTNEKIRVKGQGFFKVVFYMPNIMTATTVGLLFLAFIRRNGFIHNFAVSIGYLENERKAFASEWFGRGLIAFIQWWMWYGQTMIVLIAGILGINPSFFEAASIDGATGFQTFRKITLPLIRPIMTYTLVTSLIGGFQMFDVPNMFVEGNNAAAFSAHVTTIVIYIKRIGYSGTFSVGKACAASLLLFFVTAVIALFLFWIMRDKDAEKARKAAKKRAKEQAALEGGNI